MPAADSTATSPTGDPGPTPRAHAVPLDQRSTDEAPPGQVRTDRAVADRPLDRRIPVDQPASGVERPALPLRRLGPPVHCGPPGPRTEPPAQRSPHIGDRAAPGTVIGGRYALRTAIGHGGMGTVWRASDTLLRRDVAVKEVLLPPGIAAGEREQMYQRTMREARAAAALSHPAVVQVYDVVTEAGRPWIVMELLQARSLSEMIIDDGPLAPRAVAKIGIALLGALEVAHAAGVLHRDVKPANVLICVDGRCVLTDFGVARMPTDSELTTPGMVLGSPHFISPERAIGAPFGPPSDLFSLGVTLYTAVEGRPPFDRRDPLETMRAVVEEPPQRPLRAGSLTSVLYGLLEKDPQRRWDLAATRRVLRELLAGPLASTAAPHVTDPYAVIRPQTYAPAASANSSRIGGRALLAPDESISTALRRRRRGRVAPLPPTDRPGDGDDPTGALGGGVPAGVFAGRFGAVPASARTTAICGVVPEPGSNSGTAVGSARAAAAPAARRRHAQHAAGAAPVPPVPSGSRPDRGRARLALEASKERVLRQAAAARQLPRWIRYSLLGVALGLTALIAMGAATSWFGQDAGALNAPPAANTAAPVRTWAVQEYRDDARGIVVNVPATWTRVPSRSSYMDFVDPSDGGRRLRINVERAGGSARQFMEVAENGLRQGTTLCAQPFSRVELRDSDLNGQPAAELEYTCGQGAQMRHGIWRTMVASGRAYYFFVSAEESRFPQTRDVYDEMVRSYRLVR